MEIPIKKLENNFRIPILGLGTFGIGGDASRNPFNDDKSDIEIIRRAVDLGITHFDTAEFYSEGDSEKLIGTALKNYDRSKLFITSKVSPTNLEYEDVVRSASKSLKRLQMDYIDLYLIHYPNHNIPIKNTMKAFDHLVKNSLIKYIGVSNFSLKQFKEAEKNCSNKIVANQVQYNLLYRKPQIDGFIEYAQSNNIIVIAYRPLEDGILNQNGIKILDDMAKKYHKTQSQIAINWLISQKNIVTIPKTKKIKHLQENINTAQWNIDKSDVIRLTNDFPGQKNFCISEDFWNEKL